MRATDLRQMSEKLNIDSKATTKLVNPYPSQKKLEQWKRHQHIVAGILFGVATGNVVIYCGLYTFFDNEDCHVYFANRAYYSHFY